MKCLYPRTVKSGDGQHYVVPCGQCIACRLNRVRDWSIRLMHELRYHDKAVFITLTYDDEHLPENGSLVKRDVQLYLKRLRKRLGDNKIRFFLCGEYGEKFLRPHYHLICFGIDWSNPIFRGKKFDSKSKGYYLTKEDIWQKGIVYLGTVNYQSIRYVASYVNKKYLGKSAKIYKEKGVIPEFTLMSRKPGIGEQFVNFTGSDFWNLSQLLSEVDALLFRDIMRTKSTTHLNWRYREKLKNLCSIENPYLAIGLAELILHQEYLNVKSTLSQD